MNSSGSGAELQIDGATMNISSSPPENDGADIFGADFVAVASAGGVLICILLLLTTFCVTTILLCRILRRLPLIQLPAALKSSSNKDAPANEAAPKATEPQPPYAETKFSNNDSEPSDDDSTGKHVEAMYAVVSEKHREKKRSTKLKVQQYDDISLECGGEVVQQSSGGGGDGEPRLTVSVTLEEDNAGYSRLKHAGPRMKETSKYLHSTVSEAQPQRDSSGTGPATNIISGSNDRSYSEVEPIRPRSRLVMPSDAGSYPLIVSETKQSTSPPLLPKRSRGSVVVCEKGITGSENAPLLTEQVQSSNVLVPYQNVPSTDGQESKGKSGYSVVGRPATPCLTDSDDVMEFRNEQAHTTLGTEKLYAD